MVVYQFGIDTLGESWYTEVMDNRSSTGKKKKEHDFSLTAFRVVQEATGESAQGVILNAVSVREQSQAERHEAAVTLGRAGGRKGGPARAKKLTPEQRTEIAQRAAKARWGKKES